MSTPAPLIIKVKKKKSAWRWLGRFVGACFFVCLLLLAAAIYTYETALKPGTEDEWQYALQIKSFSLPLSISKTILWASSPKIGPWLNGLTKSSSHGQYKLSWDQSSESLVILCSECVNRLRGFGADQLIIDHVELRIHQDSSTDISGLIRLGEHAPFELTWTGHLTPQSLEMKIKGDNLSIASIYKTLAPHLPELQQASMTGSLDVQAQMQLPALQFSLAHISTNNFTVSGLGTENLRNASSSCGPASRLPMNHWLVRAIMSAEDQRFETHLGYDLEELTKAFGQNNTQGSIVRGGSTITQQTAKLLFTGSEKSLFRKMRELLYAVEMEQTLGKARIMQLYLDNAPWGLDRNGKFICGAQTAAQQYFGLQAKDLKPHQAVWLAAMLHSPMREAKSWQETGKINLERAIWIASYVRNAPNSGPRGRQKVIDTLKRDPSLGMQPLSRK